MNEQEDTQRPSKPSATPSAAPSTKRVLGSIAAGPRDSSLGAPVGRRTERVGRIVVPPPPPLARSDAVSADDQLRLPRGGWVAMRKSGGFKFSWREIFVYQDGRVKYISSERSSHVKLPARRLNDEQKLELRRLLTETRFPSPAATSRHNPDSFAYELVARVGRKVHSAEVFEGSIPGSLAPLIHYLQRLMSSDE